MPGSTTDKAGTPLEGKERELAEKLADIVAKPHPDRQGRAGKPIHHRQGMGQHGILMKGERSGRDPVRRLRRGGNGPDRRHLRRVAR